MYVHVCFVGRSEPSDCMGDKGAKAISWGVSTFGYAQFYLSLSIYILSQGRLVSSRSETAFSAPERCVHLVLQLLMSDLIDPTD